MIAIAEKIAGRASISGALLSNELKASNGILSLIRPNLSNKGELYEYNDCRYRLWKLHSHDCHG
jgi:hypothetical protein